MKYNDLRKIIKGRIFSIHDIAISAQRIFPYQISNWVKKGYLIRLKNGLYAFSHESDKIAGELVSSCLYQPSYISLEKALSIYGFIPEMVYLFTAVTTKTNRVFKNTYGQFNYRHIKPSLFWGYREVILEDGLYLLAEPEKAVLDYLYLNLDEIRSESDFNQIRWNYEGLKEMLNPQKFHQYIQAFGLKKLKRWATCLR